LAYALRAINPYSYKRREALNYYILWLYAKLISRIGVFLAIPIKPDCAGYAAAALYNALSVFMPIKETP
jgi:hypothetical protein